jgi:tRNA modification GTPase
MVSGAHFQLDDTIAAPASAPGPAARGIIRISGPRALSGLTDWFEPVDVARWQGARAARCHAGRLRLDGLRSPLDVLVYSWPTARSFTGQPLVEIHAPGSPPLLDAILARVFAAGIRSAHRGEFTLRAFLAGRIDLLQAEAVLGVIDASEESALAIAIGQLAGGVSGRMAHVRGDLLDLLADLEAGLDFVEEGIQFVSRDNVLLRIRRAERVADELLRQCQERAHTTGRRRVVLAGLPNAGKSTLFNALLAREAALVSSIAGTTRDYLSGALDWSGLAVELIDTPGWEADSVNNDAGPLPAGSARDLTRLSQELGAEQRAQADLILWCSPLDVSETERAEESRIRQQLFGKSRAVLIVATKADLIAPARRSESEPAAVLVSAKTGAGLRQLVDRCVGILGSDTVDGAEMIGTSAARCRESLAICREALRRAANAAESDAGDELVAIELHEAMEHLGRVLGTVYTDDILDRIFSRFCIGK